MDVKTIKENLENHSYARKAWLWLSPKYFDYARYLQNQKHTQTVHPEKCFL